jgi:hypothetical protein
MDLYIVEQELKGELEGCSVILWSIGLPRGPKSGTIKAEPKKLFSLHFAAREGHSLNFRYRHPSN